MANSRCIVLIGSHIGENLHNSQVQTLTRALDQGATLITQTVWKQVAKTSWPTAIAPDTFVHAEFMFRDAGKYAANGTGWGWARWVGMDQKPHGKDAEDASASCIACHTPVKDNNWVFTTPAPLPPVQ